MLDHGQLGPPTPLPIGASALVEPHRALVQAQPRSDVGELQKSRRGPARESSDDTRVAIPGLDGTIGFGRGMSGPPSMSALEVEEEPQFEGEKKPDPPSVGSLAHPNNLSAQLSADPKLASLRTGLPVNATLAATPPILLDSRCSGYFVEAVCPFHPSSN